jgi:nicotinamidase/pyrazinamidase
LTDAKVELREGDVLMRRPPNAVIISKAADPNEEQYCAFNGRDAAGRTLGENLRILKAARAFRGGVATEYCVFNTGRDILKEKYKLFVFTDSLPR